MTLIIPTNRVESRILVSSVRTSCLFPSGIFLKAQNKAMGKWQPMRRSRTPYRSLRIPSPLLLLIAATSPLLCHSGMLVVLQAFIRHLFFRIWFCNGTCSCGCFFSFWVSAYWCGVISVSVHYWWRCEDCFGVELWWMRFLDG